MPTYTCERCKREIYRFETCNYCSRKICNACMKASQKASKLNRLVICKSCWSELNKRTNYKNRRTMPQPGQTQGQSQAPQQIQPSPPREYTRRY